MSKTKEQYLDETVKKITNQKVMIAIPDEIGGWWGLVSDDVMAMLKGKDITEVVVPISSFGGDVYEAIQIFNILKSYPAKVTAYLYSKCMSAGTIIACAADEVYAVPQTVYMIHKALTYGYGNADEQRKTAQLLDITDDMIAQLLATKSGMSKADVLDLMAVESYFTAEQAVTLGFIDGLVDTIPFDFQLPNSDEFIKIEEKSSYGSDYGWLWDKVKSNLQNVDKFKVFNSADLSKYKKNTEGVKPTPQIINQTENTTMKFEIAKIWDAVKAFVAPDKIEEAKKALENQGDSLISEISNSVKVDIENSMKDRFDGFVKKEETPVFNLASLKTILNEATDEEKSELLTELGVKGPDDVEVDIADHAVIKELKEELTNVKNQLSKKIGTTAPKAENNGSAPVKAEGVKDLSEAGEAAKTMYTRMFNNSQLSKVQYDDLVSKLV